ncbi:hypothetical protein EDB81DRAFT_458694 [Dactylonectria macrodidyma]|uniref:Secreted protein n=1 Tax=Dactylonectria macrodidyma TaxID=307937 RepID=A0A9P9J7G1_9HYPO|nr:hypothetical protein EDB81DRAFT_458694 [Dactylonectria macrodidyma]
MAIRRWTVMIYSLLECASLILFGDDCSEPPSPLPGPPPSRTMAQCRAGMTGFATLTLAPTALHWACFEKRSGRLPFSGAWHVRPGGGVLQKAKSKAASARPGVWPRNPCKEGGRRHTHFVSAEVVMSLDAWGVTAHT